MDSLTKKVIDDVRAKSTYSRTYIDNICENDLLILCNTYLNQVELMISIIKSQKKNILVISAPYPLIFDFLLNSLSKKYNIVADIPDIKFPSVANIHINIQ